MAIGILLVGFIATAFNEFIFEPSGLIGGGLWALGNAFVPIAIKLYLVVAVIPLSLCVLKWVLHACYAATPFLKKWAGPQLPAVVLREPAAGLVYWQVWALRIG